VTRLEIMTSDTAKPDTTSATKPETFRSHLPAIVAATTGTVIAAVLGSLIGTAGTIVGIVIGSLASGTCSWWAERGIRRSAALATARAETLRAHAYHLHPGDATVTEAARGEATVTHAAVTKDEDTASTVRTAGSGRHGRPGSRRRWAGPLAFIGAAFVGGALVVTLMEGAAGKPLSAVVQGKPGHGTTLGGGTVGKARPSPTPSGSRSPTPSSSATSARATSPATTGASSSSPAASTAPAATASSSTSPTSSPSDSPTPTATPTGTATAG
jgi:hypothetical protein